LLALVVFSPASRVLKWEMKAIFLASVIPLIGYVILFYSVERLNFEATAQYFDLLSLLVKSFSTTIISYLVPIATISFLFWIVGIFLEKRNESARTL